MVADKVDTGALLARVDIVALIDGYVPLHKNGAEHEACCPFHTEATPSFKVNSAKQFYHCFGCGAHGDAIGFLVAYKGITFLEAVEELGGGRAADGVPLAPAALPPREKEITPWVPLLPAPDDAPAPPVAHVKRGAPQRTWTYYDGFGRVLGHVYRFLKSDGGKEVLPVVWARHGVSGVEEWRWMSFPKPRPLYGLDRLAARPEATVLLVEGEKCADAGQEELPELVVVSWPGGGKADHHVDLAPLAGRKVITWADADAKRVPLTADDRALGLAQEAMPLLADAEQPGAQTMARLRERLRGLGCKLWELRLPPAGSKPDGWDIADAVLDGLKGKELAEFIRENIRSAVPRVLPEHAEQPVIPSVPSGTAVARHVPEKRSNGPLLRDVTEWMDQSVPMQWVVDGVIQRGCLYAMTAITNHGKTAIGLAMALHVAAGRRFAEREITPGKVLILCGENPDGFRTRLHATMDSMGMERGEMTGLITVLPQALPLANCVEQILAEARQTPGDYALVLVDTSISYYSGDDEDDNLQARTHAWHLRALAELPGHPAIVANCHPTKSADRENLLPRGGGAFLNEIDTNLTVWAEGETAHLHWHRKKRGPDFDPIPFEFHGKSIEEHGMKVPTVVAQYITEQRDSELRKLRRQIDDRLLYEMLHHPDAGYRGWAESCQLSGPSQVKRVMDRLRDDKLVEKYRNAMRLTKSGAYEAERIR